MTPTLTARRTLTDPGHDYRADPPQSVVGPVRVHVESEAEPEPDTRDEGVKCPKCHCRHAPVLYTRHHGKYTVRVRECRHCKKEFRTREEIVCG